ncbi:3-isopropylmalate dehydratase small subunit [Thiospirochaeta perfilievii]|uniref:3-isopropylmalate dehydratase n=1 Tax=Thiospirochaeta perfilievii TaxID=252967 RepID=A0A5C1QHE2_9SPIO|nr:3-isopropylmalate dehydratase small subunit [Thiospirochaeta perfilievii]QEN05986.1 3-isopropylmalate dehydratase small subunit [Thiospirochaeta perfilievii]
MKNFKGKVLFLDRSDINTDEIIPARYLTEVTKIALKPYLLEDLEMEGFNVTTDIEPNSIIVTRDNFGCGSSREHAPWALEMNDINVVIAEGFARIFRQNMYNCGMLAITLDKKSIDKIFEEFSGLDTIIGVDIEKNLIIVSSSDKKSEFTFSISDFDKDLVRAGGWLSYADSKY